ncbi:MAG: hypothetical protein COA38_16270 [Fluviicola sp.]|nr:MAG: hypothetical protein COA38_16270 [Fluviicola sp.]
MRALTFFLFITSSVFAQEMDSSAYLNMKSIVEYLASDSLKGRGTGSVEEQTAAEYISASLKKSGYKVKKQKFSFVYDSLNYKSQNIIGFVNNRKDSTLLITAHYDHLGMGDYMSLSGPGVIHNGADDNASGVALMLQLADDLVDSVQNYNLLIVGYAAHELGLFGSHYFSENLCPKYTEIVLAINFDMVGRMDKERHGYFQSSDVNLNALISNTERVKWTKSVKERLSKLDSKWFLESGVPSLTISTGIHLDYHKYSDDVQYINWDGIERIHVDLKKWLLNSFR